jgi:hypothetical protein
MKSLPAINNGSRLTFIVGGTTYNVPTNSIDFPEVLKAVTEGHATDAVTLANKALRLTQASGGEVTVENGVVKYNGVPVHSVLTNRILDYISQEVDFKPLSRFLQNVMANRSSRAKNELYPFLENRGMPITDDGCFLGYKVVSLHEDGHYYDKWSGKIINDIGTKVSRPYRDGIDAWGEHQCSSTYFHVGNLTYAGPQGHYNNFGNDRVIIVKVNPKDVVSVSEAATKLITTAYEVVSDFERVFDEPLVRLEKPSNKQTPWKDIVAAELLKIQPAKLADIYAAVDKVRVSRHSRAKIRQTLAKIATKNKKGFWRLKRGH